MRIGLTCSTIEPTLTQGKIDGIGVYTKTLLNELTERGHAVTPMSFPRLNNWIKQSNLPNGKIFPLPYLSATCLSLVSPFSTHLYHSISKDIDLLHVTDHMIPRMKQTPIVATIHDGLMFTHPEWYPSKTRTLKNAVRKATFKWADHFITVSHAMIPELVNFMGIPEEKISVVYNGISPEWYEPISHDIKIATLKKLRLPKKFILFTGTLQPKKNLPTIIRGFLQLPNDIKQAYPLVIAGKIGWGAEESLSAITNLIEDKTGFWLDYVSFDDLRALYQSAACYLCPSLHEGFGYTLIEGFASGTPVITSNITALPEIAGDAAMIIDPYSPAEIKNAIQMLLTSPTLCEAYINKGKQRANAFSLEQCVHETIQVYNKVLNTQLR